MFDELVLRISLIKVRKMLHALLYGYELAFIPNGMPEAAPSAEDTLGRSIFLATTWVKFFSFPDLFIEGCSTSLPGGNQVDGLPPAAHIVLQLEINTGEGSLAQRPVP